MMKCFMVLVNCWNDGENDCYIITYTSAGTTMRLIDYGKAISYIAHLSTLGNVVTTLNNDDENMLQQSFAVWHS